MHTTRESIQTIFTRWHALLLSDPSLARQLDSSYRFVLVGEKGMDRIWFMDCRKATVVEEDRTAECAVTMNGDDFVEMVQGRLNPQVAYVQRKLKVKGSAIAALKLKYLLQHAHDTYD